MAALPAPTATIGWLTATTARQRRPNYGNRRRGRCWAALLIGDEAEELLRKLADELEATAVAIEQSQPTSPGLS